MSLYSRALKIPFVYNTIRPLVVGGIDHSSLYESLDVNEEDIVLDVGCGTGDALNYLRKFKRYWGFDIDHEAVSYAENHFGSRSGVEFVPRLLGKTDLNAIKPTRAVLAGLLHHLSDDDAGELLSMLADTPTLNRIVTQDIVYLPGEFVSNFFARLDRGRFCRKPHEYEELANAAGFDLLSSSTVRSHPTHGRAIYFLMSLEPRRKSR